MAATCKAHLEVIRLLLAANADQDKEGARGRSPLMVAFCDGNLEIVQLLL